jgi:hypothetical protein
MEKEFASKEFDKVYERSSLLENEKDIYYHLYSAFELNKFDQGLQRVSEKYPKMSLKTVTVMYL